MKNCRYNICRSKFYWTIDRNNNNRGLYEQEHTAFSEDSLESLVSETFNMPTPWILDVQKLFAEKLGLILSCNTSNLTSIKKKNIIKKSNNETTFGESVIIKKNLKN